MPITGSFARIFSCDDADKIEEQISTLRALGPSVDEQVFRSYKLLSSFRLNLEPFLRDSFPRIIREGYQYRLNIN